MTDTFLEEISPLLIEIVEQKVPDVREDSDSTETKYSDKYQME